MSANISSGSKPGMPFSESRIAVYLTKQIDAMHGTKSQREIAEEIGYTKPNMISMFKRGEAKIPIDKVPALAKAINVDPAFLFRLAMEQYWPDMSEAVAAVFGSIITRNEQELLKKIRSWTKNSDPKLITKDNEARLKDVFKDLI